MTEEYDELRRSCARAYMEHVRASRARADALRDEIDMERQAMGPKGMRFDRIGKSSPYADAIPDGVARIDGMVSRYADQLREYMAEAEAAHDMLALLSDPRHTPYSLAATCSAARGARSLPTWGWQSVARAGSAMRRSRSFTRAFRLSGGYRASLRFDVRFWTPMSACPLLAASVRKCPLLSAHVRREMWILVNRESRPNGAAFSFPAARSRFSLAPPMPFKERRPP